MAGIKLGDRIRQRIHYGMNGGTMLPSEEGTVVYIHPEGRFYTLEFTFPNRWGRVQKFRESYLTAVAADNEWTPGPRLPVGHPND